MLYEVTRHKVAYTILLFVLLLHVILFFVVWPDKNALRMLSVSLGFSYFSWGVFAHVKSQHITKNIVKEYLFASLVGTTILFLLTL